MPLFGKKKAKKVESVASAAGNTQKRLEKKEEIEARINKYRVEIAEFKADIKNLVKNFYNKNTHLPKQKIKQILEQDRQYRGLEEEIKTHKRLLKRAEDELRTLNNLDNINSNIALVEESVQKIQAKLKPSLAKKQKNTGKALNSSEEVAEIDFNNLTDYVREIPDLIFEETEDTVENNKLLEQLNTLELEVQEERKTLELNKQSESTTGILKALDDKEPKKEASSKPIGDPLKSPEPVVDLTKTNSNGVGHKVTLRFSPINAGDLDTDSAFLEISDVAPKLTKTEPAKNKSPLTAVIDHPLAINEDDENVVDPENKEEEDLVGALFNNEADYENFAEQLRDQGEGAGADINQENNSLNHDDEDDDIFEDPENDFDAVAEQIRLERERDNPVISKLKEVESNSDYVLKEAEILLRCNQGKFKVREMTPRTPEIPKETTFSMNGKPLARSQALTNIIDMVDKALKTGNFKNCFTIKSNNTDVINNTLYAIFTIDPEYKGEIYINNGSEVKHLNDFKEDFPKLKKDIADHIDKNKYKEIYQQVKNKADRKPEPDYSHEARAHYFGMK